MEVRAGILLTGSELLTGKITDANGPWLAERLGELGIQAAQVLTVGDRPDDLLAGLEFHAGRGCQLVITSGGLGPTADDLTTEAVARFAGVDLEFDEALARKIAEIVARLAANTGWNREAMAAGVRKQATVPRGAVQLDPVGTAPGLVVVRQDGPVVIVLPGPPPELQGMWPAALSAEPVRELLKRAPPLETVELRLFGLPESEIAETLRDLATRMDLSPVEITTCLRRSELEIDIRYRPLAEHTAQRVVDELTARHARNLISSDGSTTDDLVAAGLAGRRLGLAESCTGGLLAARLTDRPGSSDYLAGSVVAYSDEAKVELLGVPAELIAEHGAVSPQVARAMADGARARFGADIGCAVTGIAGPGGGTELKPVGYVCFCVTTVDGRVLARDPVLPGGRRAVREHSVDVAMHLIRRATQ